MTHRARHPTKPTGKPIPITSIPPPTGRVEKRYWLNDRGFPLWPGTRDGTKTQVAHADSRCGLGIRPKPNYTAAQEISFGVVGAYVLEDRVAARSFAFPTRACAGGPRASPNS